MPIAPLLGSGIRVNTVGMEWREHFLNLRATSFTLTLQVADDELLDSLGNVAANHIHPMRPTPFRASWDHLPAEQRKKFIVDRQLSMWDSFSLNNWNLPLVICADGAPVGEVILSAQRFRVDKTFSTSLWLGEPWRNQNVGTEAAQIALQLGFGALSADRATTKTFSNNATALTLIKNTGYSLSGATLYVGGTNTGRRLIHYRLNRRKWEGSLRRNDIHTRNMCLHFP